MLAWVVASLLLLISALPIAAQEPEQVVDRQYLSVLGQQVLSRTDCLLRGRIQSTHPMPSGAMVGRIEVLEVLDGIDPGPVASILAGAEDLFPEPGLEVLVFARRLSSDSLWRAQGLLFLGDEVGLIKLRVVRKILEIESTSDPEERLTRLRKMAIQNVGEIDPWLAWNAAQELFHIVYVLGVDLSEPERHRLSDLTIHSDDDRFSSYLQSILVGLRGRSGGPLGGLVPENGLVIGIDTTVDREPLPNTVGTLRTLTETFLSTEDAPTACRLLHQLATYPLPVVDRLLVRSLAHEHADVRATAAFLLARADPELAEVPLIHSLESDPDLRVRKNAAKSLGRIGGSVSVEALAADLEDPRTRFDRLNALGEIGSSDARAVLESELGGLGPGTSRERNLIEDLLEPGQ